MIVVDSNVIAYCWIEGSMTACAQRVRVRDAQWHVPILWRSELRSVLAKFLWSGAMDGKQALAIMSTIEGALDSSEHFVSSAAVLRLSLQSRLSAYDCEFVALAQSLAVPLVTEDRTVLKAFPDVAVTMEAFLDRSVPSTPTAHEKRPRYKAAKSGARRRLAA